MKKYYFPFLVACLLGVGGIHADHNNQFAISQADYESLLHVNSSYTFNLAELQYWDNVAKELIRANPLEDGGKPRLKSYLYTAQNEFAKVSFRLHKQCAGSIAPISVHVLQLFFPAYKPDPSLPGLKDPYSVLLTNMIMPKFKDRYVAESKQIKPYPLKTGTEYWQGKQPYLGISVGNMTPWALEKSDQFRCQKPPLNGTSFWVAEADKVLKEVRCLNESREQTIHYWADGNWQDIAEDYMEHEDTPLTKRLEVRAILSQGIIDSTIAAFDSKYTYWIKRPHMVDEEIKTVIPCPDHPSYPSGHSTISKTASTILTHYFPADASMWCNLAEECGMSRIWAGLHFYKDHSAGQELGTKVGELTVMNLADPLR